VAQSQPATPTGLLLGLLGLPAGSQRRALTAGCPASQAEERSQRRRRLTVDLINLAELKPDLQQPALAAAFAIAANPSPRGGAAGGGPHSGSSQRLRRSAPAVSPLGLASGGGGSSMGSIDELLPVRTLHFGDGDAAAAAGGGFPGVRRSATAPAAALLGPADGAAVAVAPPLAVLLARRRHTTDDAAADAGGSPGRLRQGGTEGDSCEAAAAADGPVNAASPAPRQPLPSPSKLRHSQQQQAPALVAVVAQLQEEVAVAESRRHAAESEAQQAQQTAADLRQQLAKVQTLVAAKVSPPGCCATVWRVCLGLGLQV
jgi:hypothetical protein